ncbi:hypothetical protein GCM10007390_28360 [Persicitalea jodogahamensis]|uniref:Uncharacterized protein n=2 Tax=Persicitalea jodogahamensis TaxID=402147 RepID=A0A8J3GAV9_9BACT|nr:hypothetical protein GCM10007390_28360 [Persicitalea jodogahamensis]
MAQQRPGLFFREDFKETPAETPVTQEHLTNNDLVMTLYGPGKDSIRKSHHDKPADDPYYIWSGVCQGNWAVAIKHRTKYVDLSRQGKISWRSKQSGYRQLHVILKLADGTWLVSQPLDPESGDWRVREFNISDMKWMGLNIESVIETKPVVNADLTKVEEIGWTDLMRGGRSPASSRLDWIEVSGFPVGK